MIKKLLERIPLRIFVIVCIFLASFFIFVFVADKAVFKQDVAFDNLSKQFLTKHSNPTLIGVMRWFTFLGSTSFLLPAYIVMISWFLFRKHYQRAVNILIISSSSFLVMQGLKRLFRRQRPDSAILEGLTNYSFPSGHSLSAFVFCSIVAYLVWRGSLAVGWKLLIISFLFLIAIMVGISRIVLGVHYTTDVIAGFCLGIFWVILSFWILRRFN